MENVYDFCPICEKMVKLDTNGGKIQICPSCGNQILCESADDLIRGDIMYNGKSYPTIDVPIRWINEDSMDCLVTIADIDLWEDIKADYEKNVLEGMNVDESIYFYCESGFVASNPTKADIIRYFNVKL